MPDLNIAFNAFANNYPNKIKLNPAGGAGFIAHTERISGNYLVMYELENDWTWIVSRYRNANVGGVECIVCDLTLPDDAVGSAWLQGIPRCKRNDPCTSFPSPTPSQNVDWYDWDMSCNWVNHRVYSEFGTICGLYDKDLSNSASQVNMGWRKCLQISYKECGNEYWLIDYGPLEGGYDPRYGVVGYWNRDMGEKKFTNIQDGGVPSARCNIG